MNEQPSQANRPPEAPVAEGGTGWTPAYHGVFEDDAPRAQGAVGRSARQRGSDPRMKGAPGGERDSQSAKQGSRTSSNGAYHHAHVAPAIATSSNATFESQVRPGQPGYAPSLDNPATGTSVFSHATSDRPDGGEKVSHGTLMLSGGGQSRYLGPTAGSEWLKDVSRNLWPFINQTS